MIYLFSIADELNWPLIIYIHLMQDPSTIAVKGFADDFSSEEVVKGAEHEILIQFNPAYLSQSQVYDSNSDTIYESKYNPSEIMKIVIRRNGKAVDPGELAIYINNDKKP